MSKKIGRKYLTHIQKSVFEGELTEGQLYKMESEILKVIDKNRDSVIFYLIPDGIKISRKLISNLMIKQKILYNKKIYFLAGRLTQFLLKKNLQKPLFLYIVFVVAICQRGI